MLSGWAGRASVLEPLVIVLESGYRMWFLATPHEVGPGHTRSRFLVAGRPGAGDPGAPPTGTVALLPRYWRH